MSVIKPSWPAPEEVWPKDLEYVDPPARLTVAVQTTRRIGVEVLGRELTVADLARLLAACEANGVLASAAVHFGGLAPSKGVEPPSNLHTARVAEVLDRRAEPVSDAAPVTTSERDL